MINTEQAPPDYYLFDNSGFGGSWNEAVVHQAAIYRQRAESAEAEAARLRSENERLRGIEAAMREWFDANEADDQRRWIRACRRMDALMGGTWEAEEPWTPTYEALFGKE